VLIEAGRDDVLWDVLQENTRPSYGYFLEPTTAHPAGMTTIPEQWDRGSSQNHMILAQITEWFHTGLAGIKQAPGSIAYKNVVIQPKVVGDLTHVQGSYRSPYGLISSEWTKTGDGRLHLDVSVPGNTTAEVWVPLMGGGSKALTPGPVFLRRDSGYAVYAVDPGSYQFEAGPDTVAPVIDLVMPEEAVTQVVGQPGNYPLGSLQLASYTCTDELSDVILCAGNVPDGEPFDTSTVGFHSFTVDAEDVAGNTASLSHQYNVVWDGYGGFMPPLAEGGVNIRRAGSNIPIKFSLGAYYGMDILQAGYPQSVQVDCTSYQPIGTPEPTYSDAGLTWALDKYQYDWKTNRQWNGTCRQLIVKLQDNTVHTAIIAFR
jgi:hypothetical protein